MNRLQRKLRLNVFHLEDEKDDQATFRAVFRSEIAPRLVRFFRESFNVACAPKLYQSASVVELTDLLLRWENARPALTAEAQDCGLFVLDYFVKPDAHGRPRALTNCCVSGRCSYPSD